MTRTEIDSAASTTRDWCLLTGNWGTWRSDVEGSTLIYFGPRGEYARCFGYTAASSCVDTDLLRVLWACWQHRRRVTLTPGARAPALSYTGHSLPAGAPLPYLAATGLLCRPALGGPLLAVETVRGVQSIQLSTLVAVHSAVRTLAEQRQPAELLYGARNYSAPRFEVSEETAGHWSIYQSGVPGPVAQFRSRRSVTGFAHRFAAQLIDRDQEAFEQKQRLNARTGHRVIRRPDRSNT